MPKQDWKFHLEVCSQLPKSILKTRDESPVSWEEVDVHICNYCGFRLYSPEGYNGFQHVDKIGGGKILDRVKYRVG